LKKEENIGKNNLIFKKKSMKIYLAWNVPKWDNEEKVFHNWRKDYENFLKKFFPEASFIDPFDRNLDEKDFFSVFWFDCNHIKTSDLIIINSEWTLWVWTSQEMVIAKYFKKPVITILPKGSKHRKININFNWKKVEDWIHPFLFSFSDFIIEDLKEFKNIKNEIFNIKIKDISIIDKSVEYFNDLK